ncbi:MAG: hypothetical protein QNK37_39220, partial [Acidobacteriota bacterium]|nr:hypothetical protein [Acidobacteriota bacterium]
PNTLVSTVIIEVCNLSQSRTVLLGGLFTLLSAFGLTINTPRRPSALRREQTPNTLVSTVIIEVCNLFTLLSAFGLTINTPRRPSALRREQTPNTLISKVIIQVDGLFQCSTILLGGLFTLQIVPDSYWFAKNYSCENLLVKINSLKSSCRKVDCFLESSSKERKA